jgi:hypothetical protein
MDRADIVEFIFTPLVEFEWVKDDALIGLYVPGNTYNCSRQALHDNLRAMCVQWKEEGKIEVFPLTFGKTFVIRTFEEML